MDINRLSERALKLLYYAIKNALEEDDKLPKGSKKYGVREFSDFKEFADELEDVMKKRGITHNKINW